MKKIHYMFDEDTKVLLARVLIWESKAATLSNYTSNIPPVESNNEVAKFIDSKWVLEPRQLSPVLDKTILSGDGVDVITITNLPEKYTIVLDDNEYISYDPTCYISIDTIGVYNLIVFSPQRLPYKTTITAI